MIGKLRGFIDSLLEDRCIIDVMGVGYVVFLSHKTSQFLKPFFHSSEGPEKSLTEKKQVSLIIETVVKEDAIELYGFVSEIEKIWFLELTKVQGVGAKLGLKILSFFSVSDLAKALISSDIKSFSKVSGVGPKLAQRLVTELKDSPKKLGVDVGFSHSDSDYSSVDLKNSVANDALSALENLGYKKADALNVIAHLAKNNPQITLENLITGALRELTKNKF